MYNGSLERYSYSCYTSASYSQYTVKYRCSNFYASCFPTYWIEPDSLRLLWWFR